MDTIPILISMSECLRSHHLYLAGTSNNTVMIIIKINVGKFFKCKMVRTDTTQKYTN